MSVDVGATITAALARLENGLSLPAKEKMYALDEIWGLRDQLQQPLSEYCNVKTFVERMRFLVVDSTKALRTAVYRCLRHFVRESDTIREMWNFKLHVFLSKSLERDKKYEMERCQVLKLIRRIMEVDAFLLPRAVAASVAAVASNADDPYCRMCLQTLCDMASKNAHVTVISGGLRAIINAITLPAHNDMVEPLSMTLISMTNHPRTRQYIEHSLDFAMILSPLTDTYVKHDNDISIKRQSTMTFLLTMLRCFPGLFFLSSVRGGVGLDSVVSALYLDDREIRSCILTVLFKVFGLDPCDVDVDDFHAALHRGARTMASSIRSDELLAVRNPDRYDLLMCYMSSVLVAFVNAELVPALISLGIYGDRGIAISATILLGEILHIANRLLPKTLCAQLHALPSLVHSAASFSEMDKDGPSVRSRANTLLSNLSEFGRVKKLESQIIDFRMQLLISHTNEARRLKGTDTTMSNNLLESMKIKMEKEMEESTFQALLTKSNVLGTKENDSWNWDVITELVEGPLTNRKRLAETLQKTKFIKRLLSFFRPTRYQFSDLGCRDLNHLVYIRTACTVLDLLARTDEGNEYLKANDLIQQIADFCTLEAKEDKGDEGRFLTKDRLENTMTREYLTMIGVLSRTKRGQAILQHFKIFMCLYPLTEAPGREDLSRLIVTSMDYNIEGHTRVLLAKTMTSKRSAEIRLMATEHMSVLLRAGVVDFKSWGVDLLITQLSDPDAETSRKALSILNESCDDVEILKALIAKQPKLKAVGEKGEELLMRFLSTPEGFKFLSKEETWLATQMEYWKNEGNRAYVIGVETMLAKAVNPFLYREKSPMRDQNKVVSLPPHFCGELAKTPAGCSRLKESNYFDDFVAAIMSPGIEAADIALKKQALWAVGHIGSTKHGFAFVSDSGVLPELVAIAESSPTLSLRGTAFFVIGLLSKTTDGAELLQEYGWESQRKNGICIPIEPQAFLTLPRYEYRGLWPLHTEIPPEEDPPPAADDGESKASVAEILKLAGNLSNHISADAASRNLKSLKRSHPALFKDTLLHCHIMQYLGMYKFRPQVRRFMYELMDSARFDNVEALGVLDNFHALTSVNTPTST